MELQLYWFVGLYIYILSICDGPNTVTCCCSLKIRHEAMNNKK